VATIGEESASRHAFELRVKTELSLSLPEATGCCQRQGCADARDPGSLSKPVSIRRWFQRKSRAAEGGIGSLDKPASEGQHFASTPICAVARDQRESQQA